MSIKRLLRVLGRLNDLQYVSLSIKHYSGKLLLNIRLLMLKKYHHGRTVNFNPIRNKKLLKTLKYAYRNSQYYKNTFDEKGIKIKSIREDWGRVPFLDKSIIRKEKDRILAMSDSKNYVGFVTTGGSTGEPLGFYTFGSYDAEHQKFLYQLMGYSPGDKILAMDGTLVPDDLINKNIFWTNKSANDLPYGSVALSSQYLNSKNINYYIDFIKKFKPAIIRGYPSYIDSIAMYILKNNIDLGFNIKGIQITSESFYNYQVDNIKKAFKTNVYTQYGHAEASVFGYSVDDSLMIYCSPFYGYTEVIGEDGIHVKPGEMGEIVVTGFNNYAMPFIRYRTGDLAIYDGDDNGIVKLRKINGRTQDYIYTENMEKVLLTAIVFGRHYKAFENIEKWQIVQNVPGEIIFKIIKGSSYSINDQIELQDNFYQLAKIKTEFEIVDNLPLTPRGKSKFLIQNLLI
ncbi:hypothetical protein ACFPA1_25015 [Neobacillus sp. GCM10023253]|uniref:hypothetical protein n=1 Tax=Neobacillus sp. GCM10023253 TaxID=3252644 RepID=UPI00360A653C